MLDLESRRGDLVNLTTDASEHGILPVLTLQVAEIIDSPVLHLQNERESPTSSYR